MKGCRMNVSHAGKTLQSDKLFQLGLLVGIDRLYVRPNLFSKPLIVFCSI